MVELEFGPDLPAFYSAHIWVFDDSAEGIILRFNSSEFDDMRDALKAKFGAPTSSANKTFQNRMGATFQGQVLRWKLQGFDVVASEYSDSIKHSQILAETPRLGPLLAKRDAEEAKKGASGF